MSVDERRRSELFERLAATFGPDEATTMFDLLPPAGTDVATRADLDVIEARLERRFAAIDDRFDRLERRMDEQHELLRHELTAVFRGELVTAVAGQTRAVVTASVATALSVTAAVAALAQLL
jgi:chromatin segregation and condensation protein Rec8/ScpA/Scc1 (kleisin family)